jgi:hypothetical protein
LLSFNKAALELVNQYANLVTLVTLKIADTKSREKNLQSITKNLISESWIKVLKISETVKKIPSVNYTKSSKNSSLNKNRVVKEIVKQKLKSYETYNQLKTSLKPMYFLKIYKSILPSKNGPKTMRNQIN